MSAPDFDIEDYEGLARHSQIVANMDRGLLDLARQGKPLPANIVEARKGTQVTVDYFLNRLRQSGVAI